MTKPILKAILFLITALCLLCTLVAGTLTILPEGVRFHDYSREAQKEFFLSRTIRNNIWDVYVEFPHHTPASDTNFRYTIIDENGAVLHDGGNTQHTQTWYEYVWQEGKNSYNELISEEDLAYFDFYEIPEGIKPRLTISGGYALSPVPQGTLYWLEQTCEMIADYRTAFPVVTVIGGIMTILLTVLLCTVAGKRDEAGTVILQGFHRVPADLFLLSIAALGAGAVVLIVLLIDLFWQEGTFLLSAWGVGILCFLLCSLLLWLITSLSVRIKAGGLLRKTLVGRVIQLILGLFRCILELLKKIPTVATVAVCAGFLAGCNILLGVLSHDLAILFFLTLESFVGFFAAVAIALMCRPLQKQAKSLANGNLQEKVNTTLLCGPLKEHGNDLNRIGEGMSAAVREQIKSERTKTELITNVSHDIKTPLTSIINYVDLLGKEEGLSEQAKEYVAIMERQSARLKKLTEDVVEASKASAGTLILEPTPCDVGVLLEQTVGEYAEQTEALGLNVILTAPEQPVTVFADGRRLWRVFDNLMNNICKYALANTRVYLTLTETETEATVVFANISRDRLSVDPSELTERFVRGDQARSEGGSGLGLAIARSLTELQGGRFAVTVDGDLFKITLSLPKNQDISR